MPSQEAGRSAEGQCRRLGSLGDAGRGVLEEIGGGWEGQGRPERLGEARETGEAGGGGRGAGRVLEEIGGGWRDWGGWGTLRNSALW